MTSTDETTVPDVDALLERFAAASSVSPPWRGALARLRAESTAEERLAVYQAVRDSGWISDEEGFYLVSSLVENLADTEAATRLQDLDRRMEEIEKELAARQGEFDSNDEARPDDESPQDNEEPDEYERASRQYQQAWDEIFIDKLAACGEQQIAALYTDDRDEFSWRYNAGLQSFQAAADAGEEVSPDDLIQIASSPDPPHANLQQMELQREGIASAAGSANFASWGYPTEGVSVHVRRGDAQRALNVLAVARAEFPIVMPSWTCPTCGQRIPGQWEACWNCAPADDGAPADEEVGQAAPPPAEQTAQAQAGQAAHAAGDVPAATSQTMARIVGAAIFALFVLLPLALGHVLPALFFAPLVLLLIYLMGRIAALPEWPGEEREERSEATAFDFDEADEANEISPRIVPRTPNAGGNARVRRAWHVAVLALCAFPPLGFYALYLWCNLARRNVPVRPADRACMGLSLVFSVVAIIICLLVVGCVLSAIDQGFGRP